MTKGAFEKFNIEVKLNPTQKKVYASMDDAAKTILKLSFMRLEAATRHGFGVHRETFVNCSVKEMMEIAGPLQELAVRGVIGQSHDSFMRQIGNKKKRALVVFEYDVPYEEVIFSTETPRASIPYLGSIPYVPNKRISLMPGTLGSDNKAWLWSNINRTFLSIVNNRHCLVVDCSDPSEAEGKRLKNHETAMKKLEAKRNKKGLLG